MAHASRYQKGAIVMWKKFFNSPKLWLLTALGIFLIGVIINLTPGLMTMSGSSNSGNYKETGQEMGTNKTLGEFIVTAITNYTIISGLAIDGTIDNGIFGHQEYSASNSYNVIASIILTVLMFLGIILLTRKSNSAIFALGPLAVYFVMHYIFLSIYGSKHEISVSFLPTAWNWLTLFGITSVIAMITAKLFTKAGLVKGIDQEGVPLDFTKLKNVAITMGQETIKLATAVSTIAIQFIENSTVTSTANATPTVSANATPTVPANTIFTVPANATTCPACGGTVKNGKCRNCGVTMYDLALELEDGTICNECEAPKAKNANFCWQCGNYFDKTSVPEENLIASDPQVYCTNCGKSVNMTDKYCGACGTEQPQSRIHEAQSQT